MTLTGNRKFIVTFTAVVLTAVLSGLTIIMYPEQAIGIIAALGGNITAVMTPFMVANYGENKVKSGSIK